VVLMGAEGAGVIAAVGSDVTKFKVGLSGLFGVTKFKLK